MKTTLLILLTSVVSVFGQSKLRSDGNVFNTTKPSVEKTIGINIDEGGIKTRLKALMEQWGAYSSNTNAADILVRIQMDNGKHLDFLNLDTATKTNVVEGHNGTGTAPCLPGCLAFHPAIYDPTPYKAPNLKWTITTISKESVAEFEWGGVKHFLTNSITVSCSTNVFELKSDWVKSTNWIPSIRMTADDRVRIMPYGQSPPVTIAAPVPYWDTPGLRFEGPIRVK